jgi:hypothetical protein
VRVGGRASDRMGKLMNGSIDGGAVAGWLSVTDGAERDGDLFPLLGGPDLVVMTLSTS